MLGFHHIPKNLINYSHMETINIIIIIWMEYIGMNKYLCKSTIGFRKYNKMNTNGGDDDGDDDDDVAMVGDEDDV